MNHLFRRHSDSQSACLCSFIFPFIIITNRVPLVTGGRIDHGHHDGSAYLALTDTLAMARAVSKAISMTDNGKTIAIVIIAIIRYGNFREKVSQLRQRKLDATLI